MGKKNIVLVGMPSSGKSTVGEPLSKAMNMGFIDTDLVIYMKQNKKLKDIVNEDGLKAFLDIQEKAILEIMVENTVISTGGSVVYSEKAMNHLKANGMVVFLETDFAEIQERVAEGRRFARQETQSLVDLYNERMPLYRKYADLTINCSQRKVKEIMGEICERVML